MVKLMKSTLKNLTLVFIILLTFSIFTFGQTEFEKGVALFEQARYSTAIGIFKKLSKTNKKDAEIWNYLGLAYFKDDNHKNARKAFKKAIKLSPQKSEYRVNLAYVYLFSNKQNKAKKEIRKAIELDSQNQTAYLLRGTMYLWEAEYDKVVSDADKIIALNKNYPAAYILKAEALLIKMGEQWKEDEGAEKRLSILESVSETLGSCVDVCRKNGDSKDFERISLVVKGFTEHLIQKKESLSDLNNKDDLIKTPLRIINKPEAKYTEKARRANYVGSVTLVVLFAADGKTKYIFPLNSLRYGLDQQAMIAANRITFESEMLDGKPISIVKRIQYTFSIY